MSSQWRGALLVLFGVLVLSETALAQNLPSLRIPTKEEWDKGPKARSRSRDEGRYSAEVLALVQHFTRRPDTPGQPLFTLAQLETRFGVRPGDPNPRLSLVLHLADDKPAPSEAELGACNATLLLAQNGRLLVSAPIRSATALARLEAVRTISVLPNNQIPIPHKGTSRGKTAPPRATVPAPSARDFDHQGLTGKGVIVAVIDSGIYWQHADFIRPDGTSRILALWDPFDDSYTRSGGKIGSAPPLQRGGKPLGTLYTRAQLTAALQGNGEVNSPDAVGHGTACASTAAGNGRAPGGIKGVAPEADLLIVNAASVGKDGSRATAGLDPTITVLAQKWVVREAKKRQQPVVVSLSYGNQFHAHDGSSPEEQGINALAGKGIPGVAVCAAAGNEGITNFVGQGTFGPGRPGQLDYRSQPVELFLDEIAPVVCYFNARDQWGLGLVCLEGPLLGRSGPATLLMSPSDNRHSLKFAPPRGEMSLSTGELQVFCQRNLLFDVPTQGSSGKHQLTLFLPPGHYYLLGFSNTKTVASGRFAAYLPSLHEGHFGIGAVRQYMVGAPGNATNALTIGSYDLLGSWANSEGSQTSYAVTPGELSYFTSRGPRRDGVIKPDITAPGRYVLSALAPHSLMADSAEDKGNITADQQHVGWEGTSAATPYAAGVIALMLQKNPTLDLPTIRAILRRTATVDSFTSRVPNPQWGYGKLNPAAALRATPARGRK